MSGEFEVGLLTRSLIKSCGSEDLERVAVGPRGIELNRHWGIVNDETGQVMMSDKYPKMVTIRPEICHGELVIKAGQKSSEITIPVNDKGKEETATLFNNEHRVVNDGPIAAKYLSDYLGVGCHLVHVPENSERTDKEGLGKLDLADSWQGSLGNSASLRRLNDQIFSMGHTPVPADRFGIDVWITTKSPYLEDKWSEITINGLKVLVKKPIVRCSRTLIKRESLEDLDANGNPKKDEWREPLATLARKRRTSDGVIFGQKIVFLEQGEIGMYDKIGLISDKRHDQMPEFI